MFHTDTFSSLLKTLIKTARKIDIKMLLSAEEVN